MGMEWNGWHCLVLRSNGDKGVNDVDVSAERDNAGLLYPLNGHHPFKANRDLKKQQMPHENNMTGGLNSPRKPQSLRALHQLNALFECPILARRNGSFLSQLAPVQH